MKITHDRGGHVIQNGFLGRLTCIHRLRVRPGEKVSGMVRGITRLADLVRPLSTDINQTMVAFFIPHRWRMKKWEEYIKKGPTNDVTSLVSSEKGYTSAGNQFTYRAITTEELNPNTNRGQLYPGAGSTRTIDRGTITSLSANLQPTFWPSQPDGRFKYRLKTTYTQVRTEIVNELAELTAFRGVGTKQQAKQIGLHEALIPYLISYHHLADYPSEDYPTGKNALDLTESQWASLSNNQDNIDQIINTPGTRRGLIGITNGLQMMAVKDHFNRQYEVTNLPASQTSGSTATTGTGVEINVEELSLALANYNSELDRAKKDRRYDEIIKNFWRVMPQEESTFKPPIIGKSDGWINGIDINGTGEQNLGHSAGKAIGFRDLKINGFMAPEHGEILIYIGLRTPTLWTGEQYIPDNYINFALPSTSKEEFYIQLTGEKIEKLPLTQWGINEFLKTGNGRFMTEPDFMHTKGSNFINDEFISRQTAHIPEGSAPQSFTELKRGIVPADETIQDSANTKGKIFSSTPQREWTFYGYADIQTTIEQPEPSSEFSKIGEKF